MNFLLAFMHYSAHEVTGIKNTKLCFGKVDDNYLQEDVELVLQGNSRIKRNKNPHVDAATFATIDFPPTMKSLYEISD